MTGRTLAVVMGSNSFYVLWAMYGTVHDMACPCYTPHINLFPYLGVSRRKSRGGFFTVCACELMLFSHSFLLKKIPVLPHLSARCVPFGVLNNHFVSELRGEVGKFSLLCFCRTGLPPVPSQARVPAPFIARPGAVAHTRHTLQICRGGILLPGQRCPVRQTSLPPLPYHSTR